MLTVTPIDGGYHLGAISDTTQIDGDRDINCVGHSGVQSAQSAWCMGSPAAFWGLRGNSDMWCACTWMPWYPQHPSANDEKSLVISN